MDNKYSGLTFVLSYPSRFDTQYLISGYTGIWFNECLSPLTREQCDIRLLQDKRPIKHGTKVIVCLGLQAAKFFNIDDGLTLHELRGSPIYRDGIFYITTYMPQDCMDIKDYESYLNKFKPVETDSTDEDTEDSIKSTRAHTSRSNYKFWFKSDIKKAIKLLGQNGINSFQDETSFNDYVICPSLQVVIDILKNARNANLVIDIETGPSYELWCVGFRLDNGPVYVVPVYDYTGQLYYDGLEYFLHALSLAIHRNTVVGHNIMFDIFVLAAFYKVSFGKKFFDTAITAHRLEPEIEKSLGHCISLYTMLPYHKNEGNFEPKNSQQYKQLLSYNGKDVYATSLLFKKLKLMENDSIKTANSFIYPYLLMELFGIRFDDNKRQQIIQRNERMMKQILRILHLCTGYKLLPTSSKSCIHFYHKLLKFKIVSRSSKTGNISLNEKAMLTLALKNNHASIPLILEYRRLARQNGQLKFEPFSLTDSTDLTKNENFM